MAAGVVGGCFKFYCESLSVRASRVRADHGGADVGFHGSRCDERRALESLLGIRRLLLFTPDGALLLPPALGPYPILGFSGSPKGLPAV